ncbi:hypothetical protein KEM56_007388 [Ascosphaera pollenicola]|nr:hypothetical protein KEM56_007388 [Ascosphaera pollenicola]
MSSPLLSGDDARAALRRFKSSPKYFDVIKTVNFCDHESLGKSTPVNVLYVLDSSFNPPTKAHQFMAWTALHDHLKKNHEREHGQSARLLLLLATANADKTPQPASFEDRLVMMHMLALELKAQIALHAETALQAIDIGVTKFPLFTDKATSITTSDAYALPMQQIFLMGFDTLMRILNPKYYADKRLRPLDDFFTPYKILVTLRADEDWGTLDYQRQFIEAIASGSLDMLGGNSWWAQQIEIAAGVITSDDGAVSSTKVRAAAKSGDRGKLVRLVCSEVAEYVIDRKIYHIVTDYGVRIAEVLAMMEYLIRLAQVHETFRKPELEALAALHGIDVQFVFYDEQSPFCIVRLGDERSAATLVSRSILTKGIYELWGHGTTYEELHVDVKARTPHLWDKFKKRSFKFTFDTYMGKRDSEEKTGIIQAFSYLGLEGPIKMTNPDEEFVVFEEYEKVNDTPPSILRKLYFARFISHGSREVPDKYDLKKRNYISTTSMDAELTLITANMALAAPGKLFYDPFVGTGSFCVAMAHFGAHTLGSDIDGRSFRGSGKQRHKADAKTPTSPIGLVSNLQQYGLEGRFVECFTSDLTNTPLLAERPFLDGIICDPPYGIREGLKVLGHRDGGRREPVVVDGTPTHYMDGYVPPKKPYSFDSMIDDILQFAAVTLVPDGRIAFWMPTANEDDVELEIPSNPNLELVSVCVQVFNKWSRRLLTYQRKHSQLIVVERKKQSINASADELNPFRKHVSFQSSTSVGTWFLGVTNDLLQYFSPTVSGKAKQ